MAARLNEAPLGRFVRRGLRWGSRRQIGWIVAGLSACGPLFRVGAPTLVLALVYAPCVLAFGRVRRPAVAALLAAAMAAPTTLVGLDGVRDLSPGAYGLLGILGPLPFAIVGAVASRARGPGRRILALVAGWLAAEAVLVAAAASGLAMVPVPLGLGVAHGPLTAWARLAGAPGVSAAFLGLAWAIGSGLDARSAAPTRVASLGAAVVLLTAPWSTVGAVPSDAPGRTLEVAILQPGRERDARALTRLGPAWAPLYTDRWLERAASDPADLVVLPEMGLGRIASDLLDPERAAPRSDAGGGGARDLLAGAFLESSDGRRPRNVALVATRSVADDATVPDDVHEGAAGAFAVAHVKARLVPWFERHLRAGALRPHGVSISGVTSMVLICWESLLPDLLSSSELGATDLLVVLSDTSWARGGPTPRLHLGSARMLALASARPVVFASFDGPSAIVAADGHVLARSGRGPARLSASLRVPERRRSLPLASRLGSSAVAILGATVVAIGRVRPRSRVA